MTRRPRAFVQRFVYGLIVLLVLYLNFEWTQSGLGTSAFPGYARLTHVAENFFESFLVLQFVTVLLVTPAYVGGAIAEEKERRTLDFLLTTPLADSEIVLSKLAARLGYLVWVLLTGLPILALLQLIGGIQPVLLWGGFAVTLTTMLLIGGIGIYFSTTSLKSGDAILKSYVTMAALAFAGTIAWGWCLFWVWWSSAIVALIIIAGIEQLLLVFFLDLAVRNVRRCSQERPPAASQIASGAQAATPLPRHRPPIGDSPLLWAELHLRRPLALLTWPIWLALAAFIVLILSLPPEWFGAVGTVVAVATVMVVSAEAAGSAWPEREKQMLEILLVTPVLPPEILIAKWLASVHHARGLYGLLALLWIGGLVTGTMHPLSFMVLASTLAVYIVFAASLGLAVSMRSRSRARAQLWTALILVLLGGLGPLVCCTPMPVIPIVLPVNLLFELQAMGSDSLDVNSRIIGEIVACFVYQVIFLGQAAILWNDALLHFTHKYGRTYYPPFVRERFRSPI
jgi:ABC-type Na+ efflux pump permease subunit